MESLNDKHIVATGGSRGIGLGMVEAFLTRGAIVPVVARDQQRLAEVERMGVSVWPGDLTDADLMNAVVADIRPSVLVSEGQVWRSSLVSATIWGTGGDAVD
jgi:NAD(P)-dependent dehydrogenase (short-subunit alcohol dehydrogenase family)